MAGTAERVCILKLVIVHAHHRTIVTRGCHDTIAISPGDSIDSGKWWFQGSKAAASIA